MESFNRKTHWEHIYQTKSPTEVSWFQSVPEVSLAFIKQCNLPLSAAIIDMGGGDSVLVDFLLALGYKDITVLDISESAIEKAKQRLGHLAEQVKWIVADISTFVPTQQYDFWHDRAAFHFLTQAHEISHYVHIASQSVKNKGFMSIGTFSESGPQKCSGIAIKQYNEQSLANTFSSNFEVIHHENSVHTTPFHTTQDFIFMGFRKK